MKEWPGRLIFVPILLAATSFAAAAHADPPPAGTLVSLSGAVRIRRDSNVHLGVASEPLFAGDVVSTGEIASAKMLFADDSVIDLGPKSSFRVDSFQAKAGGEREALFTVFYGRLRALVSKAISSESKFEVRTREALMGVRGTEFLVSTPANAGANSKTELTVVHGTVAVSLPKLNLPPVSVGAGSQLVATAGMLSLPRPAQLPSDEAMLIERQSRVVDNTFTRTVSVDSGIRNDKAPRAATPVAIARSSVQAASAEVASEKIEPGPVKGVGTFSVLDTFSIVPAVVVPGNFQTVTVQLSH